MASGLDVIRGPPSISPIPSDQEILPPAGIEREAFLQEVRNDITRINDVMKNLVTVFSIEPIFIELLKEDGEKSKTSEEVFQEAYDALESMFFLH